MVSLWGAATKVLSFILLKSVRISNNRVNLKKNQDKTSHTTFKISRAYTLTLLNSIDY